MWVNGYKVEISDWYDGVHDHLNIAYYKPGSSLARPPVAEHGYLFRKEERATITGLLSSVVCGLTSKEEFWKPRTSGTVTVISVTSPIMQKLESCLS